MDLLYFQFDGGPYALALEAVADVALAGAIQPVPLSPPAVKGLAERRGRPIAVIDLPKLLDDTFPSDRNGAHLIRLARPLDGTALWVPAEVFSGDGVPATGPETPGGAAGHVFIEGRLHVLLDAEALVKRAAAYC
jgi:hypothetical protein